MDDSFLKVKEVKEAMDTLRYISADDEMRAIADLRQKTINDHNSEMTVSKEEGIAIGEERGKAEGLAEGKRGTTLNAIAMGLSTEQISKLTGLSEAEIQNIKRGE